MTDLHLSCENTLPSSWYGQSTNSSRNEVHRGKCNYVRSHNIDQVRRTVGTNNNFTADTNGYAGSQWKGKYHAGVPLM